ncbi:cytochrome C [Massilia sp. IC2-477]|uniref:c-type cytochrome n=1 Tax=unclassified Massilia TaxID=2609279 RepID=UPI001D0FB57B|nr:MULTISPECIES: c-type cytochrome [unclassified Massilia]MCC2956094.1 cytochrome C [Massilia sp. IC2-477]MCC2970678.1 cytochrome C [Massilia sp. IC2-476]
MIKLIYKTSRALSHAAKHAAVHAAMLLVLGIPAHAAQNTPAGANASAQGKYIERGRYLVKVGGCNDCHTAGYGMSAGQVPEKEWLTGDQLGWHGPWGTTYPTNLRLSMNAMSENDWIRMAQTMKARPPMPWFTLNTMDKEDLRAIYRFVRHLGPAGKPAPAGLAPGVKPAGPAILFPAPPN